METMLETINTYHAMETQTAENTHYFFLENILKARIKLHMDTGSHEYDEEVNMYLAGLLASLILPSPFTEERPYISAYDFEVREYLENHPGTRNEFTVYKDNADFGLSCVSVFIDYFHAGSYYHRMIGHLDKSDRIAMYYKLAANALAHLRGSNTTSAHVYMSIAEHMAETMKLVRTVSSESFEFIERLSKGSEFHLEKELHEATKVTIYKSKLDDFLKAYQDHKNDKTEEKKARVITLGEELKSLNPSFRFEEKS